MLANQEFRAVGVKTTLHKDEAEWRAVVTFTNDRQELELETVGLDATMFALRLHTARNAKGLKELLPFAGNSDYWFEVEDLAKDSDKQLQKALRELLSGRVRFDYNPTALVSEFLTSRQSHAAKFRRLKQDYFEIQAINLLLTKNAQDHQDRMFKNKARTRVYTRHIDDILDGAYKSSDGPVDGFLRFRRAMSEDSETAIRRAWHQYKLAEDLRNRMAIQRTIPGEIGIPHLMDNYRRLSEALVPFVRVISDCVCLLEGCERPQHSTGFTKRCQIIKDSKYADLLRYFDPMIRASESHAGTEIQKEEGRVILTDRSTGARRITGEYTYREIVVMTRDLIENLFPAMLSSIHLHELHLLTLVIHSQEYLDLVLCLGNLEQRVSPP